MSDIILLGDSLFVSDTLFVIGCDAFSQPIPQLREALELCDTSELEAVHQTFHACTTLIDIAAILSLLLFNSNSASAPQFALTAICNAVGPSSGDGEY